MHLDSDAMGPDTERMSDRPGDSVRGFSGGRFRVDHGSVLRLASAVHYTAENMRTNMIAVRRDLEFVPDLEFPVSQRLADVLNHKVVTGDGSLVAHIEHYAGHTLQEALGKLKETAREYRHTEEAIEAALKVYPSDFPVLPGVSYSWLAPMAPFRPATGGLIDENVGGDDRDTGCDLDQKIGYMRPRKGVSIANIGDILGKIAALMRESEGALRSYARDVLGAFWISVAADRANETMQSHLAVALTLADNAQSMTGLIEYHGQVSSIVVKIGEVLKEEADATTLGSNPVEVAEKRRDLDQKATEYLRTYTMASQAVVNRIPYAPLPTDHGPGSFTDTDGRRPLEPVDTTRGTDGARTRRGVDPGRTTDLGGRPPHDPPPMQPPVVPPPPHPGQGPIDQVDPSHVLPTLPGGIQPGSGILPPSGSAGALPGGGAGFPGGLVGGVLGGGSGAVGTGGPGRTPGGRAGVGGSPAGIPASNRPLPPGMGHGANLAHPPQPGGAARRPEGEDTEHITRYFQATDEPFLPELDQRPAPPVIGEGTRFYGTDRHNPELS